MGEASDDLDRQYKIKGDAMVGGMKKSGISMTNLAHALDVHVTTVRRWKRGGKAYMRNIIALAENLDMPPWKLAEGIPPNDTDMIEVQVKLRITSRGQKRVAEDETRLVDMIRAIIGAADEIKVVTPESAPKLEKKS